MIFSHFSSHEYGTNSVQSCLNYKIMKTCKKALVIHFKLIFIDDVIFYGSSVWLQNRCFIHIILTSNSVGSLSIYLKSKYVLYKYFANVTLIIKGI